MGRKYTCVIPNAAVTALQDLIEILAPADAIVKILEIHLYQKSDVGDAAEEILTLEVVRGVGSVTSGTGGGTITPQPVEDGDAAFGGTVERNNTTRMVAGTGSLETLAEYGWNIRMGFDKIFTPETMPVISPGNRWTLALPAAPTDALTIGGTVTVEEIGG